jgi:hypothetical protein
MKHCTTTIGMLALCMGLVIVAPIRADDQPTPIPVDLAEDAPATQPDDATTTQPTTTTEDIDKLIEQAGPLAERPFHDPTTYKQPEEFTHNDRIVPLDKVIDGTDNFESNALYLLLEKVTGLKADDPRISEPKLANLFDRPKQYRGRPIRMNLEYRDEQVWPSERPAVIDQWHLARTARWQGDKVQGVWLISRQALDLPRGTRIEATGYFFKLKREENPSGPGEVYVPVIVVTEVERTRSDTFTFGPAAAMAALIIVLLVVFILLRSKLGKGGGYSGTYRPRRNEMTDEDIEASRHVIPPDQLDQDRSDDSDTPKENPTE